MAEEISYTCQVCLDQLTNPKTLPCLHSFCEKCLEGLVFTQEDGTGILGCPTCRFPVQVSKEGIKGLPTAAGTLSQLKESSNHVTKGESNSRDTSISCSRHGRIMKLYCDTCQSVVCNVCAIEEHHDHDYYLMMGRFKKTLEHFQTELDTVSAKYHLLQENVKGIQNRVTEIEERGDSLIDEVHSLADRLIENIRKAENRLVSQLENTVQLKTHLLKQQKEMAKDTLDQVKECKDIIEKQLTLKNPQTFFASKKDMENKTKLVKEINTSIFEAVELSDVRFKGNGTLLYHSEDLGNVTGSFIHEQVTPLAALQRKKVQAGINTTFQFKIAYQDGTPVSLPTPLIKCTLTPPNSNNQRTYSVKEMVDGTYQMSYTPVISGVYRLKIEVGGKESKNSPFEIRVAPSVGIGGTSVHIVPNLQFPWGVATTIGNGNKQFMAVTETGQHCIALFDMDGQRVKTIGSKGKEDGKFTNPRGLAVTSDDHLLVSDYERIQKISLSGHCVRSLCGQGSGPLQFADPKGICVHRKTGKILVADSNNHRIQVLNTDLSFSHSFGKEGEQDGEFRFPWDVACDSNGDVYVVDNENHMIQKFSLDSEFLLKFGGKGEDPGNLSWPSGIAVDTKDNVYVTDDNQAVTMFDTNGKFMQRIKNDKPGKDATSFKHPIGISVDHTGQVHVCDCWNSRIVILPPQTN